MSKASHHSLTVEQVGIPASKKAKPRITWFLIVIIILIALALRLPGIGDSGLWNDEAIVAAVAEHPLPKLYEEVRRDAHPPLFFVIERFIYWFHGHAHETEDQFMCYTEKTTSLEESIKKSGNIKSFVILNLFGDGLHNFLDGIIIMVGFLSGITNGIIITLAVMFHEFPQEIGDFGILVYGGFTKNRALLYNFLSAMVALFGGLVAYLLSNTMETFSFFILAFSGGGFLYIACTELMPELLKQKDLKKSIIQTIIFLSGLVLIIVLICSIIGD